jgi:hypothetical protein
MDDWGRRLLFVGMVLGAQAGLAVYAGTTPGTIREGGLLERIDGVPEYELLAEGEVALSLDIVSVDPVVGVATRPAGPQRERITGIDEDVAAGDRIRLYGERRADGRIEATSVFVVERDGLMYAYGVSLIAALWVGARVLRGWRVDRRRRGVTPRRQDEEPDA